MMVEGREKKEEEKKGKRRRKKEEEETHEAGFQTERWQQLVGREFGGKNESEHGDGETRRAIHHVLLVAEGTRVKKREKSIVEGEVEKE